MTKQSRRKRSEKCAAQAHSEHRTEIAPEIRQTRKHWQEALHECQRKQNRLVKRMVKQRLADDAEHQQVRTVEKELRQRLHAIRVRRARKRDSLHALEKKIVVRCQEIEAINEEEAVEEAKLTSTQNQLQDIEARLEREAREQLSKTEG